MRVLKAMASNKILIVLSIGIIFIGGSSCGEGSPDGFEEFQPV